MEIRAIVSPNAKKERLTEDGSGAFLIMVKEPAAGNKANERVRELVARHFHVLPRAVHIETGHLSRRKRISITR